MGQKARYLRNFWPTRMTKMMRMVKLLSQLFLSKLNCSFTWTKNVQQAISWHSGKQTKHFFRDFMPLSESFFARRRPPLELNGYLALVAI